MPVIHRLRLVCAGVCNLRCAYCHAYPDGLGSADGAQMSLETAQAILDAYAAFLDPADSVQLSFYGGEPLTHWSMVRETIGYALDRFGRDRVGFILNTNGTLLGREEAAFCRDVGVDIHLSLDGPDAEANRSRRSRGGKPAFARALRGLRLAKEAGCRVQVNGCLSAETMVDPRGWVDWAREEGVDRLFLALADASGGADGWGLSVEEQADRLLAARMCGRKQGIEVGGPWARACWERELASWLPPASTQSKVLPYLSFDNAGQAFLMPYPDRSLGRIDSGGLADVVGGEALAALAADWQTVASACGNCPLASSCSGYLRGLVRFHTGSLVGAERECGLARAIADRLPLALGGTSTLSEGQGFSRSRQWQVVEAGAQTTLVHRLSGDAVSISDDECLRWESFANAGDDSHARPSDIVRWLDVALLLPHEVDEDIAWLAATAGRGHPWSEIGSTRVLARPDQGGHARRLGLLLSEVLRDLASLGFPSTQRPLLVWIASGRADFARLWGDSTMPDWANVYVGAGRIVMVRESAAEQLVESSDGNLAIWRHELTHVLLAHSGIRLPIWLEEAVCEYAAWGLSPPHSALHAIHEGVLSFRDIEALDPATLLDLDPRPPRENRYYRQGHQFVSYLVEHFGQPAFFRFLASCTAAATYRDCFKDVFGSTLDEVEAAFRDERDCPSQPIRLPQRLVRIGNDERALLYDASGGGAIRVDAATADAIFARAGQPLDTGWSARPGLIPDDVVGRLHARRLLDLPGDAVKTQRRPRLRHLRLNLTNRCNLRCTYCYLDHAAATTEPPMTEAIAKTALREFLLQLDAEDDEPPSVRFFGGEPLLNWPVVNAALDYLQEQDAAKGVAVILNTNGLGIRPEQASFLASRQVFAVVSIDGPGPIHDLTRVLKGGKGSFARVEAGVRCLLAAGCEVGIAATVGSQNIDHLPALIDWIADLQEEFGVGIGLGLNEMSLGESIRTQGPALDHCADRLVAAIRHAESVGVDVAGSKLLGPWNALLGNRPRDAGFCAAIGRELTANPDCALTPCGALSMQLGRADDLAGAVAGEPFLDLAGRGSRTIPACRSCSIEAYCGGGCAAEAIKRAGTIHAPDGECDYRRVLFRKLVEEFVLS